MTAIELPLVLPPAVAGSGCSRRSDRRGSSARRSTTPGSSSSSRPRAWSSRSRLSPRRSICARRRPRSLRSTRTWSTPRAPWARARRARSGGWRCRRRRRDRAGLALAWGRALGEFGATLMFAGRSRGSPRRRRWRSSPLRDRLPGGARALRGPRRGSAALLLSVSLGRSALLGGARIRGRPHEIAGRSEGAPRVRARSS